MNLRDHVETLLQWYVIPEEHPNSKRTNGCVQMLGYSTNSGVIEIGFVALRSDGKYWNFTNNRNIYCRGYTGKYFDTVDDCAADLYPHVLDEVCRFIYNHAEFHYSIMTKFKKRDAAAFKQYAPSSIKEGFKAGVDWALRSEGIVRRPQWAMYSVQNRDGSLMWFENEPVQNHNKGIWECSEGRSQKHTLHENWSGSLTKVA